LVELTWPGDSADDRAVFVEALAEGLGAGDEAFLESALDDRSRRVRSAAADLLAVMPASAFSRRMADRAAAFLKFVPAQKGGLLKRGRGATLEISLPPEPFDPAWARDGLTEKPAEKMGVRQWWLRQLVAYVPLAEWTARWNAAAQECIAAAKGADGNFGDVIVAGWIQAAARGGEADWISALVLAGAENDANLPLALLGRLEPDRQREILAALLRQWSNLPSIIPLLEATSVELDQESAKTAIEAVDRHVSTMTAAYDPNLTRALDALALRLPPGFADALTKTWGGVTWSCNDKPRERFLHLLSLRRDIQKGFNI
jgi:hypothetical protein